MDARLLLAAGLAALLVGCATQDVRTEIKTVEIKVPVPVIREPPPELFQPIGEINSEVPEFVLPTDTTAASCLTPDGERRLRAAMAERQQQLLNRIREWEIWSREKP